MAGPDVSRAQRARSVRRRPEHRWPADAGRPGLGRHVRGRLTGAGIDAWYTRVMQVVLVDDHHDHQAGPYGPAASSHHTGTLLPSPWPRLFPAGVSVLTTHVSPRQVVVMPVATATAPLCRAAVCPEWHSLHILRRAARVDAPARDAQVDARQALQCRAR